MAQKEKHKEPISLSGKKKIVFYLIMILIPVLLFLLLELALRFGNYGYNLDLFVKSKDYPGYYQINKNVAKRFFTKFKGTEPSNDVFLINKPDTCYRVFVMGCSTTRGFPYTMGTTFSRILNYRLQDAFPHKRIEVINTAMAAINSFSQADFIDEILTQKPDAILIYTGHNEYYGALGVGSVENGGNIVWLKKIHLGLIKFRTYQLIQNMVGGISKALASGISSPSGTLMERIAKDKAIEYNSQMFIDGNNQFEENMGKVIAKAKNAGIPLIIADNVSNIRDMKPFKSVKTASYPSAIDVYKQAQKLESEGNFEEAKKKYYYAKDLDCIRFRSSEILNETIEKLGKRYNIPVLSMRAVFEAHSPHGLIGNNLITEHLHPNVEGYFLMADAFFNIMKEQKLISNNWDTTFIKTSQYYRDHWGFTTLDSLYGDIKVRSLKAGWPFQPENVVNRFIYTYVPQSYEDSLAIMSIKYDNVYIEDQHTNLAKHYASLGENHKAFMEMYSLIKTYPYLPDLYYQAVKYAMAGEEYVQVRDLLLSMPDHDTIYGACLRLAKVYEKLNDLVKAINWYEKAGKVLQKSDNVEYFLVSYHKACIAFGNIKKAEQLMAEIKKINPAYKPEETSKPEKVIFIDKQVKELIDKAIIQARKKNYSKAIEILKQSIKIKESSFAYQMIGSLMFEQKDMNALQYLEKAYSLDSKDANTLNNLFVIYLMKKDFPKASKCLDELKLVSSDFQRIQKMTTALEKAASN